MNAGCLHAEEKDFKTAFSYFYEALENFDSIGHERGIDCLKYMLLMKIMMNAPDDVTAIINGKPGMRHQGAGLEAMLAVGTAHKDRSLHDFEAALAKHADQLAADNIIQSHLNSLYDMLLQENICRIIEVRVGQACPAALLPRTTTPRSRALPQPSRGQPPLAPASSRCGQLLAPYPAPLTRAEPTRARSLSRTLSLRPPTLPR